jgi:hypothetical protein
VSLPRPRPQWTQLRKVVAVVVACAAMLLGLAAPASASGQVCSGGEGNACEYVYNGSAGNPFIYWVKVWNPWNLGTDETYRLLINGTVIRTASGTAGYTFQLNEFFNPGTCIQGGVLNVPDGRTPCWYVP